VSSTDVRTEIPQVGSIDTKLAVVTLPVSGVDRATRFYRRLGCIDAAREDLISRGVEVSETFHLDGERVPGRDPQARSYQTHASYSDPDGNGWSLQEITTRLPGREWDD
jgi:predicted lactoylglutathione lyase